MTNILFPITSITFQAELKQSFTIKIKIYKLYKFEGQEKTGILKKISETRSCIGNTQFILAKLWCTVFKALHNFLELVSYLCHGEQQQFLCSRQCESRGRQMQRDKSVTQRTVCTISPGLLWDHEGALWHSTDTMQTSQKSTVTSFCNSGHTYNFLLRARNSNNGVAKLQ